jgi:two-component system, cell cycle response regulator
MLLSRDELITTLFQETDRAQRFMTSLAVILCGIDEWENCQSRLGKRTLLDAMEEITLRIVRVLRCYDSLGRLGDGEYCLILPGCNSFNAVGMAERLRQDVFGSPVSAGGEELRFRASFGIAGSGGRSPLVVLRNAENALRAARMRGSGSIERSSYDAEPDPATFPIQVCRG